MLECIITIHRFSLLNVHTDNNGATCFAIMTVMPGGETVEGLVSRNNELYPIQSAHTVGFLIVVRIEC